MPKRELIEIRPAYSTALSSHQVSSSNYNPAAMGPNEPAKKSRITHFQSLEELMNQYPSDNVDEIKVTIDNATAIKELLVHVVSHFDRRSLVYIREYWSKRASLLKGFDNFDTFIPLCEAFFDSISPTILNDNFTKLFKYYAFLK